MTKSRYILWERRRDIHEPPVTVQIIMSVAIIGSSALIAFIPGLLGLFFTSVSGAFLACLLCTSRKPFHLFAIPLSFVAAFAVSGSPVIALAALLYLPLGLVLAYSVFTERSLSVTTVALTVVTVISMAAFLTITVTNMYGEGIKESYKALYDEFTALFRETLSLFRYNGPDGEVYTIPESTVSALIEQSVMLMPCMCVLLCELYAYGCAKLFRLYTVIYGYNVFFSRKKWAVTLSAPAGAILAVSLIISILSPKASVITYAAINLAYIIIPLAAIAGFHDVFGRDGLFRRQPSTSGRIIIIASCAFMGLLSPFYLAQMLALIGSMSAIVRVIAATIKKHRDENNPE